MRMVLIVAGVALLAACGGSSDDDSLGAYGLKAQAEAYVNAMPSVIFVGQPAECSDFYIKYNVVGQAASIPKPASVTSVSVRKNGQIVWSGPASTAESGQAENGSLYGVARGCRPASVVENDLLDISINIEAGMRSGSAQTQVNLFFAS